MSLIGGFSPHKVFDIHAIKLSTKLANSHIQGEDGEESDNNGVDDDVDNERWEQLG